ncbi:MAG: hypothetical protein ACI837_003578 [Crocinitomicaceae bacterium]|jgi:hypothetical protein
MFLLGTYEITRDIATLLLIAVAVFLVYLFTKKSTKKKSHEKEIEDNPENLEGKTPENPYEGLRNMAFSVDYEQLGIKIPDGQKTVYGVIMDWEMGGAISTTVAYQSGGASMYLSTGGGIIGGGHHKNVRAAVRAFVDLAANALPLANLAEGTPLPEANTIRFYLLTNDGTYVVQESMERFEDNSSPLVWLFDEGNKVLTELRLISD